MPIEIESQLSPLVHQYNWLLYRVPLRRIGDDHTVYLGNGKCRIYTTETLPDCIKCKLTMILASPDVALHDEGSRSFGVHSLMVNNSAHHMNDIGWRASDTFFVVVISSEDVDSLIGESLCKEQ
jgi:hypothetical protein